MFSARTIEKSQEVVQFERLIERLKNTQGLIIKPSFYYKDLSLQLKQHPFNLGRLNTCLEQFLEQSVMPNAVILNQYINQLFDLHLFDLARGVYQLALESNLADKYVYSSILNGMSKMPSTDQQLILRIHAQARSSLGQLNEFHFSSVINALAKASVYDFNIIEDIFFEAKRQRHFNRYVYLSFLNALERHPSFGFTFLNEYWQNYKNENRLKDVDIYNQFLLLFSKVNLLDSVIIDDIFRTALDNRLANYTTYLRTFLGLLECCSSMEQLFSFYKLINDRHGLPYWVHHQFFSSLVKFEDLSASDILTNLGVEYIREVDKKSDFYMQVLYLLKRSRQLIFSELWSFYLKALPLLNKNVRFYAQVLDVFCQSQQIDLSKLYKFFEDCVDSDCAHQDLLHKVLQLVDSQNPNLNIDRFVDFLLKINSKSFFGQSHLMIALKILEKTTVQKNALDAAVRLYQKCKPVNVDTELNSVLLNFFMRAPIDTKYAYFVKSITPKLEVQADRERHHYHLSFNSLSPGDVYFGMLNFILKTFANYREKTKISIQITAPLQLSALNLVLVKLKRFVEHEHNFQDDSEQVVININSIYNKFHLSGGHSAFSPYVSKK